MQVREGEAVGLTALIGLRGEYEKEYLEESISIRKAARSFVGSMGDS